MINIDKITDNDSIRRSIKNTEMELSDGKLHTKFNLDAKTSYLPYITEALLNRNICLNFAVLLAEMPLLETDSLHKIFMTVEEFYQ